MSVPPSPTRTLLPMAGQTHGNRSAVTCHLRCGDACSVPRPTPPRPRTSATSPPRRSVAARSSGTGLTVAALTALSSSPVAAAPGGAATGTGKPPAPPLLPHRPPGRTLDDVTVPAGYRWDAILRWGDPILAGAPAFDPAHQTPEAQAGQFGYNNDYLDIIETSRSGTSALLVCNHEYTNENIMFPAGTPAETVIRTAWAAHGMSVVELTRRKRGDVWTYVPGARLNRRITLDTPFAVDGPAAGSDLLKTKADPTGRSVRGTMNNCAGGTTPWGTVLSGEENFNQYFRATGTDPKEVPLRPLRHPGLAQLALVDPRWDATTADYKNEPNRFGWIVEVDPTDPSSTPVKHTAMGRFKHEGANVIVNRDGHVVAYMGDDERFDYLYRFVSRDTMPPRQQREGAPAQPRPAQRGRPVRGPLHRRRPRGRRQRRHRPVAPADPRRPVGGPGLQPRGGARLHAARRRRRPAHQDGPPRGRRAEPEQRPHLRRLHQQHQPHGPQDDEPNPRNANKDGHVVEIIPDRATTRSTPSPGTSSSSAVTPRPPDATSAAGPARSPRSRAPTTSRSTARATCGSPPTASPARSSSATACSRCRSRDRSADTCSSSSPYPRAPRPAARSSAIVKDRCSSPSSTRARTVRGRPRSRASRTSSPRAAAPRPASSPVRARRSYR